MEDSATDGGEVEPSVCLRRPHTDRHSPDSPTPPSPSLITDTYPVQRPSFPSTYGTSTRSLPPSPPSKVGKARKYYKPVSSGLTKQVLQTGNEQGARMWSGNVFQSLWAAALKGAAAEEDDPIWTLSEFNLVVARLNIITLAINN